MTDVYAVAAPLPAENRAPMLKMLGLGLIVALFVSLISTMPAVSAGCEGTALTVAALTLPEITHPA